ncbi:eEF1-gamma domain-containing protein, partial [Aureobasidium melanogenum]
WENANFEEYSLWRMDYKYNDELTMTFMTSNLIGGFFTRLEASRKYIFGAASVYGTSNDSIVRGAFLVRGQEALPAFDVAPDVESYEFTKLDPKNPEDKKFVEDMWAWDAPIQPEGKEWADGKVFNTIDPTTICVPVMVHFPNEIWLGVANYLKLPTDVCTRKNEALDKDEKVTQQTLISLCLVYKQLRAVFQPQLYCSFIKHRRPAAKDRLLKSDSEWLHKYYQQDERSFRAIRKQTRLENFLVTIIQRPDLATMVEQLRVGSFTQDDTHEEVFLHKATSRAFVTALRSFERFDHFPKHFRRSWRKSLKGGEEGAEVALLLTLLPNLRSLRFDSESGSLDYFVTGLFKTILGSSLKFPTPVPAKAVLHKRPAGSQSRLDQSSQIFRSLRSLDVWSFDGNYISLGSCVGLIVQPSITSFHGRGLCVSTALLPIQPETTFTSLRHLQLIRCKLDGDGLESVLKRCTKLQSLEINTKVPFNPDRVSTSSITKKNLDPLQNMTGTLERLKLMLYEDNTAVSLNLSSFGKLRRLHMDMALLDINGHGSLYIYESLPESIEKITIRRAYVWMQDVDRLLDAMIADRRFSTLSSLRIYALNRFHEYLQDEVDYVQERARALQLYFQIGEDPRRYSVTWRQHNPDFDSGLDSD